MPVGPGVLKRCGKGVGLGAGESAVAVVEQNGNRQAQRGGGENQIEAAIAIDVAGDNLNAAGQGKNRDELAPSGAEADIDPILSPGKFVAAGPDGNLVGTKVAVEVVEGGANSRGGRNVRRLKIFSRLRYFGRGQDGEKEKGKSASETGRCHAAAPAVDCFGDGRQAFHDSVLQISII